MNGLEALKVIRPCANVCGGYDTYCDVIEKELKASEIVSKYLDVKFERTSAGKPIMFVRSKTLGQGWFIHISEEDYRDVGETSGEAKK